MTIAPPIWIAPFFPQTLHRSIDQCDDEFGCLLKRYSKEKLSNLSYRAWENLFFRWIFVSSHLPVRFLWAKNKGKPKMMARVALGQNIKIKRYFCFHYFRPTPPGIGSTGNSFFVPVIHKIWEELIRSKKCTDWALYCFFAVLSGRTFCSVFFLFSCAILNLFYGLLRLAKHSLNDTFSFFLQTVTMKPFLEKSFKVK